MKKLLILSILFIGAFAMNVNAQTEVQNGAKIEFTKEVHNYGKIKYNGDPNMTFGFASNFNYKNFDFDVSIDIPKQVWVNGYDKRRLPFDGAKKVDNKFYCLNTHQQLNSDFYGNVYAVGSINIAGYKENIDITVNATTRKGTKFTLPLYGGFDVKLEDYVIFTDSTSASIEEDKIDLESQELREELGYRRRLLAKVESDGSIEKEKLDKLKFEVDSLDKRLSLTWPEYAQQKKNLLITWDQVQQSLEEGEAAIEEALARE